MKERKKEYFIGDIASIIGVSRDTLRFYEKKGILSARKKDNGYRYYTEDDIFELSSIFYHRKMHIGLEEIEHLWSGTSTYEQSAQIAKQKIEEEETKIREHQQVLSRLYMFQEECRKIQQNLDRMSVRAFPDAYVIETCASQQEGLIQWFYLSQVSPGLDMTYTYDSFSFADHTLTFQNSSLLLYKEPAGALTASLDLTAYPQTRSVDCLYTLVESPTKVPEPQLIENMIAWGQEQGLKAGSIVTSNYILHSMRDGVFHFYLELYIPVISS